VRLGLFGGRFDPPHLGHLLAAQGALEALALDELWFVPAKAPPHKPALASPADRLQMLTLATRSNPAFKVSELELRRGGPSYTFDTVAEIKRRRPADTLFFITGVDAYAEIASWYRAYDLVAAVNMVAVARPGYNLVEIDPAFRQRVQLLETRLCEISSTEIRDRLRRRQSVRYLVPDSVETYLDRTALYRQ
jgi:nicotinate-nucleotide adenylyltransferase